MNLIFSLRRIIIPSPFPTRSPEQVLSMSRSGSSKVRFADEESTRDIDVPDVDVKTDVYNLGQLFLLLLSMCQWCPDADDRKKDSFIRGEMFIPIDDGIRQSILSRWSQEEEARMVDLIKRVESNWMHLKSQKREDCREIVNTLRNFLNTRPELTKFQLEGMLRRTRATLANFFSFQRSDNAISHYEDNMKEEMPNLRLLADYSNILVYPEMLETGKRLMAIFDKVYDRIMPRYAENSKYVEISITNLRSKLEDWDPNFVKDREDENSYTKIMSLLTDPTSQVDKTRLVARAICMIRCALFFSLCYIYLQF